MPAASKRIERKRKRKEKGEREREREREREEGEEGREQSVNESGALVIDWQKSGDQRERRAHGVVTLDTDQLTRFTFHLGILHRESRRFRTGTFLSNSVLPSFSLSLSLFLSLSLAPPSWDLTLDDRDRKHANVVPK